jgi:hypothetical protein
MRNVTDKQQDTLIGVTARIPVPEARKIFLAKVERRLPRAGRVTDEQLAEIINAALASFKSGTYYVEEGVWRGPDWEIPPAKNLKEAADRYMRLLRDDWPPDRTHYWPPIPPPQPPTPEQIEEGKRMRAEMETPEWQEGAADRFELECICNGDEEEFARRKAEEAESKAGELVDATPWPLPSPPTTQVIRGEVVHEQPEPDKDPFPSIEDMRRAKALDQPDAGADSDNRGREHPASAYGEAVEALRRRGKRRLRDRIGLGGKIPKSFF